MMKKLLLPCFLFAAGFMPNAGAADVNSTICTDVRLALYSSEEASACYRMLEQPTLTARQRAIIRTSLGSTLQAEPSRLIEKGFSKDAVEEFWFQATQDDPTYVEPFLALSTARLMAGRRVEALQIVDAGLQTNGRDGRLLAQAALINGYQVDFSSVDSLCERMENGENLDHLAFQHCGIAQWEKGDEVKAAHYFEKAIEKFTFYNPLRRGAMSDAPPAHVYANFLAAKQRYSEAIAVFEMFDKLHPQSIGPGYLQLGEYQEKVGRHLDAAESFRKLSEIMLNSPFYLPLDIRRMANLAMGGKREQAQALWYRMSSVWKKREILQLQVKLKNGTVKDFVINGVADKTMFQAMEVCLQDSNCFKGLIGQTF